MTLLWEAGSSMTVQLCARIAYTERWPVFALGAGHACYGGASLAPAAALLPGGTCSSACPGDSSAVCGGPAAVSVYALQGAPRAGGSAGSSGSSDGGSIAGGSDSSDGRAAEEAGAERPKALVAPSDNSPAALVDVSACVGAAAASDACRAAVAAATSASRLSVPQLVAAVAALAAGLALL
jgi:hypothetical protein